jgi:plasmid stabilization system protein ParE
MKAVFSSGALRDIRNILEYYRREAGDDVSTDLHTELKAAIDLIKKSPASLPPIGGNLRRAILRRFPYQVIYRIESAELIRILVVRHHRRDPDFGLNR